MLSAIESNRSPGLMDSLAPILSRLLRSHLGRVACVFALSFVCVLLVSTAAGFSGARFALLLAGCGAAADAFMLLRRTRTSTGSVEDLSKSVTIVVAASVLLLILALAFREFVRQSLS
jgi:hypothetical protein